MHETHASWVFVAGERAYKLKKPVALGFLDYSTLDLRHSACREEVRVNQELNDHLSIGASYADALLPRDAGGADHNRFVAAWLAASYRIGAGNRR